MAFSVGEAISNSFNRTMQMLFKPFDAGKWFVMGFCAWLAYLGEGGYNFNGNFSNRQHGGGGPDFSGAKIWITEHLALVVILSVSLFILLLAVGVVLAWLRARGQFMFLDGVVRNRGAVVEPWHQFRQVANSLFWFNLVLGLVSLIVVLMIAGLGLLLAWGDIQAGHFGIGAGLGIAAGVLLFLPWIFASILIYSVLRDFVVPIMYLRNVRTLEGWRILRREILPGHVFDFALFYLVKFGLGIVIALIVLTSCCLTCCLTGCIYCIPYLGTVLFLPLLVFMRCYSLYYLEQAGPPWRIFFDEPAPATVVPVVAPPPPPVSEVPPPTVL
jgi:hypothetical protein